MYFTVSCFLIVNWFVVVKSQGSCRLDSLDEPLNFPQDSSGARPVTDGSPGTIPIDSFVLFACPGAKAFEGKSEWKAHCRDSGSVTFIYDFVTWPECQCNEGVGLFQSCPLANVSTVYAEDAADLPKTRITVPIPKDKKGLKITLTMDTNITGLEVDAEGAGLVLLSDMQAQLTNENAEGIADMELIYNAQDASLPRWQHVCVKNMECEFHDSGMSSTALWVVIVVVTLTIIIILFCVFLLNYYFGRKRERSIHGSN